jgi:DNA-binding CsgD family transcriptional regulator
MKKELTKREKEVLKLISEGLTAKEIGKQLGISKRTIEAHTANMLEKTEAKNKAHLVAMWFLGMTVPKWYEVGTNKAIEHAISEH